MEPETYAHEGGERVIVPAGHPEARRLAADERWTKETDEVPAPPPRRRKGGRASSTPAQPAVVSEETTSEESEEQPEGDAEGADPE